MTSLRALLYRQPLHAHRVLFRESSLVRSRFTRTLNSYMVHQLCVRVNNMFDTYPVSSTAWHLCSLHVLTAHAIEERTEHSDQNNTPFTLLSCHLVVPFVVPPSGFAIPTAASTAIWRADF